MTVKFGGSWGSKKLADVKRLMNVALLDDPHRGVECPCCGTAIRSTTIHLDRNLVRQLIWFVKEADENENLKWVDVPTAAPAWIIRSRSYNRLRYFGLLERKDYITKLSPEKKGLWRPTNNGVLFVRGDYWAPEAVTVRQGKVESRAKKLIDCCLALGTEVIEWEEQK